MNQEQDRDEWVLKGIWMDVWWIDGWWGEGKGVGKG